MKRLLLALPLSCWFFTACTPKIYLMDRHTILEDEAAGEWPDFDAKVHGQAADKGPVPFSKIPPGQSEERLYNVLNGEMVSSGTSLPNHQ